VSNSCRIKNDHIRPHTCFEYAAICQAHALRGKSAEFPDCIFERKFLFLANVLAQDSRERAVRAWMRMLAPQYAFGRSSGRIVVHRYPGLLQGENNIGF